MLPERLQRAEGPAEALADELPRRFGSLGPGDGLFVVADAPPEAADSDSQIGVFGHGVRSDATGGFNGFLAPSPERAWDDCDAVQKVKRALFHVLAGDVFERLPACEPARAIAHLDVAGYRAKLGIGKMAKQFAD